MRKRILLLAATLALLTLLSSCSGGGGGSPDNVRPIYYLTETAGGRSLGYEAMVIDPELTLDEQIEKTIELMKNPVNENNTSLIREDLNLRETRVFGSTVVVYFDGGYGNLSQIEASLLEAGVALSLTGIEEISYVRIVGDGTIMSNFIGNRSIFLDDDDLRLTTFEIEIYAVDHIDGGLFPYQLRIISEKEELTPMMVLREMLNGDLGISAPFDGRMDTRAVTSPDDSGVIRVDVYVPVEMNLEGREDDIYSIVNSLCACRGVDAVNVVINGRSASSRGLLGCDGPLLPNLSYLGGNE